MPHRLKYYEVLYVLLLVRSLLYYNIVYNTLSMEIIIIMCTVIIYTHNRFVFFRYYIVASLRDGGSQKFNFQNKTATATESTAQVVQPTSILYI